MARQEGTILLTGPVGNLSFYKSRGKYFVRRKSGVNGDRIKSEPAFARTRENISEFRQAVLATKLLRVAFSPLLHRGADNRVSSRLTGLMVRVIQGDVAGARGERTVSGGNLALLEGFEFNKHCRLSSTFSSPFTCTIDRAGGTLTVDIPSFIPSNMLAIPRAATHFQLKVAGAAIDFEASSHSTSTAVSAQLEISDDEIGPVRLTAALPPASTHPIFIVLGIEFLQSVNGITYPLDDHSYNAMAIAKVGVCVPGQSQHEKATDLRSPNHLYQKGRERDHGLRKPVRRQLALAGRETLSDELKEFWRICDDESKFENHLDSS